MRRVSPRERARRSRRDAGRRRSSSPTATPASAAGRRAGCASRRRDARAPLRAHARVRSSWPSSAAGVAEAADPRVLVFTKTTGHRHDSIPAAIQAVRDLGARNGFEVTTTEDATTFTAAGLAPYDAVDLPAHVRRDPRPEPAGGVRDVHPRRARLRRASTRPPTPSAAGRGTGGSSAPGRPATPRSSRRRSTPSRRATARPPCCPRAGHEPTSGTRSRRTRDERRARAAHPRRDDLPAARVRDGRRPSDRLAARVRRRPGLVHAGRAHDESYSEPLFLGHLLGGIQYALAGSRRGRRAAEEAGGRPAEVQVGDGHRARQARRRSTSTATSCTSCTATARRPLAEDPDASAEGRPHGHDRRAPGRPLAADVVLLDPATRLSRTTRVWVGRP